MQIVRLRTSAGMGAFVENWSNLANIGLHGVALQYKDCWHEPTRHLAAVIIPINGRNRLGVRPASKDTPGQVALPGGCHAIRGKGKVCPSKGMTRRGGLRLCANDQLNQSVITPYCSDAIMRSAHGHLVKSSSRAV